MDHLNKIKTARKDQPEGYPFRTPPGYFEDFDERLNQRLNGGVRPPQRTLWMKTRPFLALAAAISGVALLSFTLLQLILGNRTDEAAFYDIAFLEETGTFNDEWLLMEALDEEDPSDDASLTTWEEAAMNYLASNEMDLEALINEFE